MGTAENERALVAYKELNDAYNIYYNSRSVKGKGGQIAEYNHVCLIEGRNQVESLQSNRGHLWWSSTFEFRFRCRSSSSIDVIFCYFTANGR